MKSLVLFEFKKIWKKKITKILAFGILILCIFSNFMLVNNESYEDASGATTEGITAARNEMEAAKQLEGPLTDERISQLLSEFKQKYKKGGDAFYNYYFSQSSFWTFMMRAYAPINSYGSEVELFKLSADQQNHFYDYRRKKINKILDVGGYSKEEKAYWKDKNAKVEAPFYYRHLGGAKAFTDWDCPFLVIAILVICICILPSFSEEYQTGADSILLTSKYGKNKLMTAKVIAAYLFGTVLYGATVLVNLLFCVGVYGTSGGDAPIQFRYSEIPYAFTAREVMWLWILMGMVVLFGMIAVNLFLSAHFKNTIPILIIDLIIVFLPLPASLSVSKWIAATINIFPVHIMNSDDILRGFFSFQFGGTVIDVIEMVFLIYLVAMVIFIPFARRGFRNHQVQ
ncbi:hypothetical protein lbkm_4117 [Lachnospiraceae bacterium KM106-2]|nr:hypothetical protein lbkm_4117 [Lachnospiraceae bacterium KM106-2]